MARVKTIFVGTESSETEKQHMECYSNHANEIYISIEDSESGTIYDSQFICLDKATAIKLHRELKKHISFLTDEL